MGSFLLVLLFLWYSVFFYPVFAQSAIKINEFSIEPNQVVELVNISSESADISRWYIDDNGGTTYFTIPQNTVLYPNACYLFSSDFNLNKSSADSVRLFDNSAPPTSSSAKLVDSFSYKNSPGSNLSFFRSPDGNDRWATGPATLGLSNTTEISCIVEPKATPTPTPTSAPSPITTPTATPQPTPTGIPFTPTLTQSPSSTPGVAGMSTPGVDNVYLSEVMVNPETGGNEWVELYNGNDFDVNLQDWYIDDAEGAGSSPKKVTISMQPYSYAVVDLTSSMFNNDADQVRLLDETKSPKDGFEYSHSQKGTSWGRIDFAEDTFCQQTPTKNGQNGPCIDQPTSTPAPTSQDAQRNSSPKAPAIKVISPVQPTRPLSVETSSSALSSDEEDFIEPGAILGAKTPTATKDETIRALLRSLSLSSGSFSVLTIVSVLRRMKMGL